MKLKYSTLFFLIIFALLVADKNTKSISVVRLSRLNRNMLKQLISLRKVAEPKTNQDFLEDETKKNDQTEQNREEEQKRFLDHYYEPKLGILNFYGSF